MAQNKSAIIWAAGWKLNWKELSNSISLPETLTGPISWDWREAFYRNLSKIIAADTLPDKKKKKLVKWWLWGQEFLLALINTHKSKISAYLKLGCNAATESWTERWIRKNVEVLWLLWKKKKRQIDRESTAPWQQTSNQTQKRHLWSAGTPPRPQLADICYTCEALWLNLTLQKWQQEQDYLCMCFILKCTRIWGVGSYVWIMHLMVPFSMWVDFILCYIHAACLITHYKSVVIVLENAMLVSMLSSISLSHSPQLCQSDLLALKLLYWWTAVGLMWGEETLVWQATELHLIRTLCLTKALFRSGKTDVFAAYWLPLSVVEWTSHLKCQKFGPRSLAVMLSLTAGRPGLVGWGREGSANSCANWLINSCFICEQETMGSDEQGLVWGGTQGAAVTKRSACWWQSY